MLELDARMLELHARLVALTSLPSPGCPHLLALTSLLLRCVRHSFCETRQLVLVIIYGPLNKTPFEQDWFPLGSTDTERILAAQT